MQTALSNLPPSSQPNSSSVDSMVQAFNNFYAVPVELSSTVLNAMVGFFENKGFDVTTAQSIALVIMTQAHRDNFNPMTVLDSLKGVGNLELSNLATQILNYNRSKTSFLGMVNNSVPFEPVQRNIIA
jgi:hypothetical protein